MARGTAPRWLAQAVAHHRMAGALRMAVPQAKHRVEPRRMAAARPAEIRQAALVAAQAARARVEMVRAPRALEELPAAQPEPCQRLDPTRALPRVWHRP
jgi:hypothetical protein